MTPFFIGVALGTVLTLVWNYFRRNKQSSKVILKEKSPTEVALDEEEELRPETD